MPTYVTEAKLAEVVKKLNERISGLVTRCNAIEGRLLAFEGEEAGDASAIAELKAEDERLRAELDELLAPPHEEPPVDLRPWVTPIQTDTVIGEVGKTTTLSAGTYEHVEFRGTIVCQSGEIVRRFCRFVGPHGMGEGGTLTRIDGASVADEYCEYTGSEGRSGVYGHQGEWTPIEVWVHDNGIGKGKQFQQVYFGGGSIVGGKGGLIENGEDNGLQAYSPTNYTAPVRMIEWDGLEVRNCKQSGIQLARRVEACDLSGLNCHGNAYGIRGYELEGPATPRVIRDAHLWDNGTNVGGATSLTLSGIIEAAP